MWKDAGTARVGAEVDFLKMLRMRAGYIWDERVTSPQFASAFGTPAADTHTGTFGIDTTQMLGTKLRVRIPVWLCGCTRRNRSAVPHLWAARHLRSIDARAESDFSYYWGD